MRGRLALYGLLVLSAALAQVFWNAGFSAFEDWRGPVRYAAAAGAVLLALPLFTHVVLDETLWLGRRNDASAPDRGAWPGFANGAPLPERAERSPHGDDLVDGPASSGVRGMPPETGATSVA